MSPEPTGRTALVTGASRGIGLAVARRLSADGWALSLGMRRPETPEGVTGPVHTHVHDALAADETAWADAAREEFGRIDAVVCCAGIMTPHSVIEAEDDVLDEMWEVNVKSPRRLIRAAWPDLCEAGGRVVILASLSGNRVKSEASGSYAVTKHAAIALSHGVRQAGWRHGVRATAICPGYVATDMTRKVTDVPRDEMSQPEDVAALVALALETPRTASVAEMHVNCRLEETY